MRFIIWPVSLCLVPLKCCEWVGSSGTLMDALLLLLPLLLLLTLNILAAATLLANAQLHIRHVLEIFWAVASLKSNLSLKNGNNTNILPNQYYILSIKCLEYARLKIIQCFSTFLLFFFPEVVAIFVFVGGEWW